MYRLLRFLLSGCYYKRIDSICFISSYNKIDKELLIKSNSIGIDIEYIRLLLKILSNINISEELLINIYHEEMSITSYLQIIQILNNNNELILLKDIMKYDDISLFHYTLLTE